MAKLLLKIGAPYTGPRFKYMIGQTLTNAETLELSCYYHYKGQLECGGIGINYYLKDGYRIDKIIMLHGKYFYSYDYQESWNSSSCVIYEAIPL